jgi:hypothetical protein
MRDVREGRPGKEMREDAHTSTYPRGSLSYFRLGAGALCKVCAIAASSSPFFFQRFSAMSRPLKVEARSWRSPTAHSSVVHRRCNRATNARDTIAAVTMATRKQTPSMNNASNMRESVHFWTMTSQEKRATMRVAAPNELPSESETLKKGC